MVQAAATKWREEKERYLSIIFLGQNMSAHKRSASWVPTKWVKSNAWKKESRRILQGLGLVQASVIKRWPYKAEKTPENQLL